jgi:hypothetical protein
VEEAYVSEREPELIMSPLCRNLTQDGYTIEVHIYRCEESKWTLEVVDPAGGSTVWDDEFETDELAFEEFHRELQAEGIHSFEDRPPGPAM